MYKWLSLCCLWFALPGCAWLPWGAPSPEQSADRVLFSHGQAVQLVLPEHNAWSPTAWPNVAQPAPAEPVRNPSTVVSEPELTVYFANDSDALSADELSRLRSFASQLQLPPSTLLDVTGHTDSNHTPLYNVDLSRRRSETVRAWLKTWGVDDSQINIAWQGLRQPATSNADEDGRARNRRVEIRLRSK